MTHCYFKGYKAIYDYDKQDWFYEDTGESATKNPRPCRQCGHDPVKDGEIECDYCLGYLGDNVVSACCGHGTEKGFILFEDGRLFVEERRLPR